MLTPRFNGTARFDPSYGMGPGAMGFAGHMGPQGIYHVPTYMNEVSNIIPKHVHLSPTAEGISIHWSIILLWSLGCPYGYCLQQSVLALMDVCIVCNKWPYAATFSHGARMDSNVCARDVRQMLWPLRNLELYRNQRCCLLLETGCWHVWRIAGVVVLLT